MDDHTTYMHLFGHFPGQQLVLPTSNTGSITGKGGLVDLGMVHDGTICSLDKHV
jgi:hypothetical protein